MTQLINPNVPNYKLQLDILEDFSITKIVGGEITPVPLDPVIDIYNQYDDNEHFIMSTQNTVSAYGVSLG